MRIRPSLWIAFLCVGLLRCSGDAEFSVSASDTADIENVEDNDIHEDEDTENIDVEPDVEPDIEPDIEPDGDIEDVISNGEMFASCARDEECLSNYCIDYQGEMVCTELCAAGSCPEEWACNTLVSSGSDAVRICVPDQDTLCGSCENNTDCGIFGNQCITVGGRNVCGQDCSVGRNCPDNFLCNEIMDLDGNYGWQCVPMSGVCSCNPEETASRPCVRTSEWGVCEGVEVCNGTAGWSVCSASPPAEEICDGRDNDCDNLIDEEMEPISCDGPRNDIGVCTGLATCNAEQGYICDALTPSYETCDEIDNDCDGIIDNGICYDGNPCTRDICVLGGSDGECNYPPQLGPCDDGNACTTGEICSESGTCEGVPVDCNDNNPCTTDSCNPTSGCINAPADNMPCETGNLCTNDICQGGVCIVGSQVTCSTQNQCEVITECRPDTGCITHIRAGETCDDDDDCTVSDVCTGSGQCVGAPRDCSHHECDGVVAFCTDIFGPGTCVCL